MGFSVGLLVSHASAREEVPCPPNVPVATDPQTSLICYDDGNMISNWYPVKYRLVVPALAR